MTTTHMARLGRSRAFTRTVFGLLGLLALGGGERSAAALTTAELWTPDTGGYDVAQNVTGFESYPNVPFFGMFCLEAGEVLQHVEIDQAQLGKDPALGSSWRIAIGGRLSPADVPDIGSGCRLLSRTVTLNTTDFKPNGLARVRVRVTVTNPQLGWVTTVLQPFTNRGVPVAYTFPNQTPSFGAFTTVASRQGAFTSGHEFLVYSKGEASFPVFDTAEYYRTVKTSADGASGSAVIFDSAQPQNPQVSSLATLQLFRDRYGMGQDDSGATDYVNVGDLGVGRRMKCVKTSTEYACYVKNYSTSLFSVTFGDRIPGASLENIEDNRANKREFAAVAMVFRSGMSATSKNRTFFVVYGPENEDANLFVRREYGNPAAGSIQFEAALDNSGTNVRVPNNCLSCHAPGAAMNVEGGVRFPGRQNAPATAQFLPFDPIQLQSYTKIDIDWLNDQIVRPVALASGNAAGGTVARLVSGWIWHKDGYDFVPPNYTTAGDRQVYREVVAPYCRSCHIASVNPDLRFETAAQLAKVMKNTGEKGYKTICDRTGFIMPHAEMTYERFWQSGAHAHLLTAFGLNSADCRNGQ